MHQIHFLENRKRSFVLDIDNHTIELTKRSNNFYKTRFSDGAFDSSSLSELSDMVDGIEKCLINHMPLNQYVTKLSGATVFRLCETLYPDETKEYWEYELRNRYVQGESCAKESIFNSLFGIYPSVSVRSHPFFGQLTKLYRKYKGQPSPKHILEDNKASDTDYEVHEIPTTSASTNIMAYSINGQPWLICLSGHQEMNSANTVLECLHQLQSALNSYDFIAFKDVISRIGHLGALGLMEMLFRDDTYKFFSALAEQRVLRDRQTLAPAKLCKPYLGPKRTRFYLDILAILEVRIPEFNKYLIESSKDVINTSDAQWILYEEFSASLYKRTLHFSCPVTIRLEAQEFLRSKANKYIMANRSYAKYIHDLWNGISIALQIIGNIHVINTILDLTLPDVQYLVSYLTQISNYEPATQKRVCLSIRAFYSFHAHAQGHKAANPFAGITIPKRINNPTVPIHHNVILTVIKRISGLPVYVQLAFYCACITGARASSICGLTKDCLLVNGDEYALRVQYYKTEVENEIKGKPSFVTHIIPKWLGEEIIKFVMDTEDLRAELDEPYIFCYRSATNRNGSLRKPKVLNPASFIYEIDKMLSELEIYDENGLPVKATFQNIRAEVGRSLFASGCTPQEVASKLGNTPIVASAHYNHAYPEDVASKYNELYTVTIEEPVRSLIEKKNELTIVHLPIAKQEMYGTCHSSSPCTSKTDCRTCPQRVTCSERSPSPNDIIAVNGRSCS